MVAVETDPPDVVLSIGRVADPASVRLDRGTLLRVSDPPVNGQINAQVSEIPIRETMQRVILRHAHVATPRTKPVAMQKAVVTRLRINPLDPILRLSMRWVSMLPRGAITERMGRTLDICSNLAMIPEKNVLKLCHVSPRICIV